MSAFECSVLNAGVSLDAVAGESVRS